MDKQRAEGLYNKIVTVCLCVLLALCLCFPAQWQVIKIPFLAVVCMAGFYAIIYNRGKVLERQIWVWMCAYLVYNLVWVILGAINDQPAVKNYFRLGVIWPGVFLLIIATVTEKRIKWIDMVILGALVFQTVAIIQMVGYGFQWWPNLLNKIFPVAAVGIHTGYIQVTGHFIGGMAFTVPYVYCKYIFNHPKNNWWNFLALVLWFAVVWALVASSRRILIIVLAICVLATVVIAFLHKGSYKKYIFRSICGAILTAGFVGIATITVADMATTFLNNNFDEIYQINYANKHSKHGQIKYVENIVLDIESTDKYTEMYSAEPDLNGSETLPTDPSELQTDPLKKSALQGFANRMTDLVSELMGDSVRGKIISGALRGWADSPIVGVGFGAELPGYPTERGDGTYEMEYVVRLYTTGVVGLLILLTLLSSIGIISIKQMRKNQKIFYVLAPCIIAYLGALVATMSNPYIFSGFDFMWMLFLPIALVNCAIKENKRK